jgi:hypothetical protein
MLTVSPLLWAVATFMCLRTFPKSNLLFAALFNSGTFLLLAILMDYVFFGLLRNAMEQLYHPTTFYGYGFVASLPFIAVLGFRKKIEQEKRDVAISDFLKAGTLGFICCGILTLIIMLNIAI